MMKRIVNIISLLIIIGYLSICGWWMYSIWYNLNQSGILLEDMIERMEQMDIVSDQNDKKIDLLIEKYERIGEEK